MKKLIATLMSAALLLATFAGCAASPAASKVSVIGDTSSSATTAETPAGDPVKLTMCFMNWVGAMDGQQAVAEAMNEITRKSIGVEITLEIMDSASYAQQMTLKLAGGEQADLFSAISVGYSKAINNGYTLDLEEDDLLATYGKGITDTMSQKYIDACRFGGKLYGLPNQRDMAIGMNAYAIGSKYLDGIGYKYSADNIIKVTQEEVNTVLDNLHKKFPDLDTIAPQTATVGQSLNFDALGGDNYGVLLDPENSLEISDLFSSDSYKDHCTKWYTYKQNGLVSGDALTNDVAATTQVRAGTAMSYQTATKPGIKAQESNLCGQNVVILQAGNDFLKSSAVASMPWCISSNTKDKVAAMKYLNELYTNAELSKLLCWGIEGSEWKYTDDGHIAFADGVTADTSKYLHNVNWQLPNQFIAGVFEGDSLDLWEQMTKFNDGAVASKALGFMFDNTSVSTEFTALANIYTEYQKQLEYGFADPATTLPEVIKRMTDAGLERYIAEKKTQLDAWSAAQK